MVGPFQGQSLAIIETVLAGTGHPEHHSVQWEVWILSLKDKDCEFFQL